MSDKFTWQAGDIVLTQCALCRHLAYGPAAVCAAFPGAIPAEILANEVDHRMRWIDPTTGQPGDQGIPLQQSITFEPADGIAPAALDALYRHLDRLGD